MANQPTTLAASLRGLVLTYQESLLLSVPNGTDYEAAANAPGKGRGGHGTHGERGRIASFGSDPPLSVRIEGWFARAAAYWRHELDRERLGVERAGLPPELVELAASLNGIASQRSDVKHGGDRHSSSKKAEDRQVLATKGDAIVVGLLFGRSSESVRKLRDRHNQDPHSGEYVPIQKPLTARELPEELPS